MNNNCASGSVVVACTNPGSGLLLFASSFSSDDTSGRTGSSGAAGAAAAPSSAPASPPAAPSSSSSLRMAARLLCEVAVFMEASTSARSNPCNNQARVVGCDVRRDARSHLEFAFFVARAEDVVDETAHVRVLVAVGPANTNRASLAIRDRLKTALFQLLSTSLTSASTSMAPHWAT